MAATLKISRWYEGAAKDGIAPPPVDVTEVAGGGGWYSVADMKRKRIADFRSYSYRIDVTETEFGFRTEKDCDGAFAGLTRVEVIELLGAA